MKITIIGHSGCGKSTLAQKLASHYQIPCLHMDKIAFNPNWVLRDEKDIKSDLARFLECHNDWIIDGVYSKHLFSERLELADTIIYLNFNRFLSFYRIIQRYLTYKGKSRPSAPDHCPEQIDWEFLTYSLYKSRRKERQNMYQDIAAAYPEKFVELCTPKDLEHFLCHFTAKSK